MKTEIKKLRVIFEGKPIEIDIQRNYLSMKSIEFSAKGFSL